MAFVSHIPKSSVMSVVTNKNQPFANDDFADPITDNFKESKKFV